MNKRNTTNDNELTLSDSIKEHLEENNDETIGSFEYLDVDDVKDYIRKLKDKIVLNDIYTADEIFRIINELAGDKLL